MLINRQHAGRTEDWSAMSTHRSRGVPERPDMEEQMGSTVDPICSFYCSDTVWLFFES